MVVPTTFSDLPVEIRYKIWELSIPEPRSILVIPSHYISNSPATSPPTYIAPPQCWGNEQPSVLHINRESRDVALRHLTLRFECYWNFETDLLCVTLQQPENGGQMQFQDMRKRGLFEGVKMVGIEWYEDGGPYSGAQLVLGEEAFGLPKESPSGELLWETFEEVVAPYI